MRIVNLESKLYVSKVEEVTTSDNFTYYIPVSFTDKVSEAIDIRNADKLIGMFPNSIKKDYSVCVYPLGTSVNDVISKIKDGE